MCVKLKESCAACAASKIKCGKQKPTCRRCTRKGIDCEYRPSNRRGQLNFLSMVDTTLPPASEIAHWAQAVELTVSSTPPTPSSVAYAPQWAQPACNPIEQSNVHFQTRSSVSLPVLPQTTGTDNEWVESQALFFPTIDGLTPVLMDDDIPSSYNPVNTVSQRNNNHACHGVVVQMLEQINVTNDFVDNIHAKPSKCPPLHAALLEKIIDESNSTIESLDEALGCSCLRDEFVVALLPLLISKIVAGLSDAGRRSLSCNARGTLVDCHVPDQQRQKKASLVMSGLHRVRKLLHSLSERVKAARSQPHPDFAIAMLSEETFEQMETDMQKCIKAASREILDMLRPS